MKTLKTVAIRGYEDKLSNERGIHIFGAIQTV